MEYAIAIDVGGNQIKYALVSRSGTIGYESIKTIKQPGRHQHVIDLLKQIVTEAQAYANATKWRVTGIGIGVPSLVEKGVVLFANNLPELDNINLETLMSDFSRLRVRVANDADLMGLGEVRYGNAGDISDAIFLTIGTGIGGALILNKQLYNGYKNRGGELGHIIIDQHGIPCSCGARGCLEAYASVNALTNQYRELLVASQHPMPPTVDGRYIFNRYLASEKEAVAVMQRHFGWLATGIVSLIHIFAPQQVIIGGGISEAGEDYIDPIRRLAYAAAMKESACFTHIVAASLGNKAGYLGAAALVFS
ncbi:ROK family protein [Parapedobacter defluvii]|uniref:ROK family protein n=1 Tax=Parapedobacter defluvii TaxID=2045106 RepID=UPI003341D463